MEASRMNKKRSCKCITCVGVRKVCCNRFPLDNKRHWINTAGVGGVEGVVETLSDKKTLHLQLKRLN